MLIWCGVLMLGSNSLNLNGKEGAGNGLINILILNKDFIFYCIVIRCLTFGLLPLN